MHGKTTFNMPGDAGVKTGDNLKNDVYDLNNLQVCFPEVLREIYKRWRDRCIANNKLDGPVVLTCDIKAALDFDAAARKYESEADHERLWPRFKINSRNFYQFYNPPVDVLVEIGKDRSMAFDCGLTLTNYQGEFVVVDYSIPQ